MTGSEFIDRLPFIILCLLPALMAPAQDTVTYPCAKTRRFSVGLDYYFNRARLDYSYYSSAVYWNSSLIGERTLSGDELDEMNSYKKVMSALNTFRISFGMVILCKTHWNIGGKVSLGPSSFSYDIHNTRLDSLERKMSSGFTSPVAGLDFDFGYHFNPRWGIALQPSVLYTFGTTSRITDNEFPEIPYFQETRKNIFHYIYTRINLLASYTINGFTVSAGPGFYYLYLANHYRINRTTPLSGYTYDTEVSTSFYTKSFFDGCIVVDWTIIPALSLGICCAIGNDFFIQPGVRYNF